MKAVISILNRQKAVQTFNPALLVHHLPHLPYTFCLLFFILHFFAFVPGLCICQLQNPELQRITEGGSLGEEKEDKFYFSLV